MKFGTWGGIDLLMCVSDIEGADMSENNAAIAGRYLDGFGAHSGEVGMDPGLVWFDGRKIVVFLRWCEVSKRPSSKQ
jgi:hypothetical protein